MRNIPFSPPDISDAEINEIIDTLRSGWLTTGPKTKMFEQQISDYCRTNKSATFNSATAAMEMTLRLLGIGPGDEVITTAYTYTASASVIHHVGAKIVLVDSEKDSYHINYDEVERAITSKTKAIIAVDIAGVMCDYKRLYEIVETKRKKFNPTNDIQKAYGRVIIIADGAHSFGASYAGEMSGEAADFTAFSFHAVKNLTTGEGGAITWKKHIGIDDEYIYKQYMLLSLHGQSKDALSKMQLGAWEYDIVAPNYKCNMTDIMASLGIVQLKRYSDLLTRRKEVIDMYEEEFKNTRIKMMSHFNEVYTSSGHLLLTRITGVEERERNNIIIKMAERGIATNVHYKPLPMLTAYKKLGLNINDYPNAFQMYKNEITLPLHTKLTDDDVYFVSNEFKKIIN
ncbi:hypothetical protein T233_00627 [Vagococcus lutrae LBD1]|uniref:Uncharacterized protein n=1 Tax=Vagococcus lutrae LBD1 TaxID=1408226 RepID=V6Q5B9_9ENTE|nr:hypothetical protein T233_00627 [Vagococcus lutrae LBD1]